jgi:hypothetical protein
MPASWCPPSTPVSSIPLPASNLNTSSSWHDRIVQQDAGAGSTYQMNVDSIDPSNQTDGDLSMSANAIFFAPSISTFIENADRQALTTVAAGIPVHDTTTTLPSVPSLAAVKAVFQAPQRVLCVLRGVSATT